MLTILKERINEVLSFSEEDNIVGIFSKGSYNYGLNDENSDFDVVILVWNLESLNLKKKYMTSKDGNGEIYFQSMGTFILNLKKSDLLTIDSILFSKNFLLNPKYEDIFSLIYEKKEDIAYYYPRRLSFYAYLNIASNYKNIYKVAEGAELIAAKWLSHMIRVCNYLKQYYEYGKIDFSLEKMPNSQQYKRELLDIKRNKKNLSLIEIQTAADRVFYEAKEYVKYIRLKCGDNYDKNIEVFLNNILSLKRRMF